MANGFTRDGGVQEQIDATVIDAINRARSHLHHEYNDTNYCLECGELIPEARRNIILGVELCVECQAKEDAREKAFSAYNRRASKDSQLR
ncbi:MULTISPECIES: DksA/TraR family C4-type zinc finger protein [Aliivibrio]|uniref:DksA/TraR family C4-type zinc finger protein n=1 Tax=Aliivibrio finisterrensis TaxID=511998 RepID=A0A4V1Z8K2_9GAMM|nr:MULTISPECIES: DksA/TraR family C4-type zinc finger protein [Aliivibrio]MDD9180108.1 DksA/TraR family C4-type zinc finger protein [Aliivibrio sp. A6]RYU49718.1 DksA/TraR family C4-type zinc finger protein [Aliivibrio finisterrensis]RYU50386.1 DksA/TraR family C4-type zinc finger protein [Aliivibrio finisterrensis]RYU56278.1 DksA/TraR family C4-type zinc finger protein [Aliivibrio finisterrensis]RYU62324.1 DksA/TraR family C4-type zinc finger protein [Aliivibrio finisterrensis]